MPWRRCSWRTPSPNGAPPRTAMGRKRLLLLGVLALGMSLCACAPFPTLPSGDRGPEHTVDVSKVPDAVPGDETPSRSGNPSRYTVLGKTYDLVPSCKGYHDR